MKRDDNVKCFIELEFESTPNWEVMEQLMDDFNLQHIDTTIHSSQLHDTVRTTCKLRHKNTTMGNIKLWLKVILHVIWTHANF